MEIFVKNFMRPVTEEEAAKKRDGEAVGRFFESHPEKTNSGRDVEVEGDHSRQK